MPRPAPRPQWIFLLILMIMAIDGLPPFSHHFAQICSTVCEQLTQVICMKKRYHQQVDAIPKENLQKFSKSHSENGGKRQTYYRDNEKQHENLNLDEYEMWSYSMMCCLLFAVILLRELSLLLLRGCSAGMTNRPPERVKKRDILSSWKWLLTTVIFLALASGAEATQGHSNWKVGLGQTTSMTVNEISLYDFTSDECNTQVDFVPLHKASELSWLCSYKNGSSNSRNSDIKCLYDGIRISNGKSAYVGTYAMNIICNNLGPIQHNFNLSLDAQSLTTKTLPSVDTTVGAGINETGNATIKENSNTGYIAIIVTAAILTIVAVVAILLYLRHCQKIRRKFLLSSQDNHQVTETMLEAQTRRNQELANSSTV